jgi:calcium-dependent protein kinase
LERFENANIARLVISMPSRRFKRPALRIPIPYGEKWPFCTRSIIPTLFDVFEDSLEIHLVTELCTGGELYDRVLDKAESEEGHFSEDDAAILIRDILDAIRYCHDVVNIVHRDLKPENFLLKDERDDAPIKIIDFGLSRFDNAPFGIMQSRVGT